MGKQVVTTQTKMQAERPDPAVSVQQPGRPADTLAAHKAASWAWQGLGLLPARATFAGGLPCSVCAQECVCVCVCAGACVGGGCVSA